MKFIFTYGASLKTIVNIQIEKMMGLYGKYSMAITLRWYQTP